MDDFAMKEDTIPFKNFQIREYPGHKKKVHSVAWNCTGTKLAFGSVDQTARIWHIEPHGHGKVKDVELKGHTDSVDQLCWDPKHVDLIATASGGKTVRVWDARSMLLLGTRFTTIKTHILKSCFMWQSLYSMGGFFSM